MRLFLSPCHPALLISFFFLLTAGACYAMSSPSAAVNMTEPRNAAAGFAITLWMANADALETHCSTLQGEPRTRSKSAMDSWKKRNAPYVDAALKYMLKIEDDIAAKQGENARQKFRAERKADFVQASRNTEAVWFPDGTIDDTSCVNVANHVEDGSLDLDKNKEFFPTLQQIKADMDGSN